MYHYYLYNFLTGITFYVGNYLYDYTLNPVSNHTLFENVPSPKISDSTQWLDTHSVNVSIQSYDDLFYMPVILNRILLFM